MSKKWWDTTDKIEMLPTQGEQLTPRLLSPAFAWPESIHQHWDRIYSIRQEAYKQGKKYRNLLPYKKKHLAYYRRAWDKQPAPAWVAGKSRAVLRIGLCVDDMRRPISFEEACAEKIAESALGIAHRQAANAIKQKAKSKRDKVYKQTQKSVKEFRRKYKGKFVCWEVAAGREGKFKPRFDDNRPLYVTQVHQKVHASDRGRFYLQIGLTDSKLQMFTLAASDFEAWIDEEAFYVSEWPYTGTTAAEIRPMKRQRLIFLTEPNS